MNTQNQNPAIILLNPQMGDNIGASARAMLNFGLTDLRLVAPRDGWPNIAATQNSAGALDIVKVTLFDTLAEASADLHYTLITSARRRDMIKPVFSPQNGAKELRTRTATGQKTAFVFGPERAGATNEDISHCNGIITIPTNPDFSSLNLGQSVLLIAHEWLKLEETMADKTLEMNDTFPVPHQQMDEFLTRLENELVGRNFFRTQEILPTMTLNIKNMFTRCDLSDQEVRTLHGIISALISPKRRS